ncbi:hypothetical protein AWZ03_014019 [Drosophila navojoa]|uniref:Uncharacterized protein n=1 Tax=Drosophila navojoa TaxID=7232 RepID=A0A484ASJ0_DRONA|nr:uncharacterized protein LOC108658269 [Drosophila navojoa]TDG39559.1 hypothetical protein AWZ03_014019 [Drosophila navojoa]
MAGKAAHPNTDVRARAKARAASRDKQRGASARIDEENDEDFSFAHFERQWRRYLVNFERRRLQNVDFFYGNNQTGLYGEEVQAVEFEDAIDAAATSAIYDDQHNRGEDVVLCDYCKCNCNCASNPWHRPHAHARGRTKNSCNDLGHSH